MIFDLARKTQLFTVSTFALIAVACTGHVCATDSFVAASHAFRIQVPLNWRLAENTEDHVRWEYDWMGAPAWVEVYIVDHEDTDEPRSNKHRALSVPTTQRIGDPRRTAHGPTISTEFAFQVAPLPVAPIGNHRVISYRGHTLQIRSMPYVADVKLAIDSLELQNAGGEWKNVATDLLATDRPTDQADIDVFRTKQSYRAGDTVTAYRYLAVDHTQKTAYFIHGSRLDDLGDTLEVPNEFGGSSIHPVPIDQHRETILSWIAGPEAELLESCKLLDSRGPYIVLSDDRDSVKILFDCMRMDGELSVACYSHERLLSRLFVEVYVPVPNE